MQYIIAPIKDLRNFYNVAWCPVVKYELIQTLVNSSCKQEILLAMINDKIKWKLLLILL